MKVGSWPGPEILAIYLIAENQPFDSTWYEKFRCNRHGRLMADRVSRCLRQKADVHRMVWASSLAFAVIHGSRRQWLLLGRILVTDQWFIPDSP